MKTTLALCSFILATSLVSGCSMSNNQVMGTAGGAVVGGVAGNLLTGGSTAGTAIGAVGGGFVGNQLTR